MNNLPSIDHEEVHLDTFNHQPLGEHFISCRGYRETWSTALLNPAWGFHNVVSSNRLEKAIPRRSNKPSK
jgi:hypothetical protein